MPTKTNDAIPAYWTFKRQVVGRVTTPKGKSPIRISRRRRGYVYPDDPSLFGEVILRGIAENA